MKLSPIVLAIAMLGMTGTLQAGKRAPRAVHRVRRTEAPKAVHKVLRGETAARIARKYNLELDELAALNPGINLHRLSLGMRLRVAGKAQPKLQAKVQATPEAPAQPTAPIENLPTTPRIAPGALVHLERMLPAIVQVAPAEPVPQSSAIIPESLRPVLPQQPVPQSATTGLPFEAANPDNLNLLWPVETRTVSSKWGPRVRTKTVLKVKGNRKRKVRMRYNGRHKGVDLNAPQGTDVYAALDGQVVGAGFHRQYGNFVVIDHGNGVTTLYAHNCANYTQEGDVVHRGQKIAAVGRTGRATGPHLHFELRLDGVHRNPLPFLNDEEEISAEMMAQNQAIGETR